MTALPLGLRRIDALRTLTTEALAVLMPFKAQEVRDQGGVYYGQNVISKNLIIANRKELLNGKGVYRKGTGTPRKQQAVRPQAAQGCGKGRAEVILTVIYHRQPNMERGLILCRQ